MAPEFDQMQVNYAGIRIDINEAIAIVQEEWDGGAELEEAVRYGVKYVIENRETLADTVGVLEVLADEEMLFGNQRDEIIIATVLAGDNTDWNMTLEEAVEGHGHLPTFIRQVCEEALVQALSKDVRP